MKNAGERGFTLIEVMFAEVFLMIGLLAIAAMQDVALSRNVDARRLTIATNLAVEMLERVWFNAPANSTSVAGTGYPYHNIAACNYACTGAQITAVCSACSGVAGPGNATAVVNATANGDYNQWLAHLSATDTSGQPLLPNAIGTVSSVATGPAAMGQVLVTVTVRWSSGIRTPVITMTTVVAPL